MKIAFCNSIIGLPVPSTLGGGAEELLTILLNENQTQNSENEFYFVQKYLYGQDAQYMSPNQYKNSKLVYVKYNRFLTFIQRAFNKCLKILKIKRNFPTVFPTNYHHKMFKEVKKIKPDIIIFEGQIDANIRKYQKTFGKSRLYLHLHIQDMDKVAMDKNVAGIIAVSDFVKKDYESFVHQPMDNYVLYNCVDENRFSHRLTAAERTAIRQKYHFTEHDFVVVFCGRIAPEKGIKELCESVLNADANVKLLIVGGVSSARKETSPYLQQIQKIANEHQDRIRFTGYVKNDELYQIYQSADVQVVPSIWEEAAGLVVIEGQLSGLPQIITKSGGMVEYANPDGCIVIDKDELLVGKMTEAIEKLQNNPQLAKKMGSVNQEFAKKFNKKSYYNNFNKIIQEIAVHHSVGTSCQ